MLDGLVGNGQHIDDHAELGETRGRIGSSASTNDVIDVLRQVIRRLDDLDVDVNLLKKAVLADEVGARVEKMEARLDAVLGGVADILGRVGRPVAVVDLTDDLPVGTLVD